MQTESPKGGRFIHMYVKVGRYHGLYRTQAGKARFIKSGLGPPAALVSLHFGLQTGASLVANAHLFSSGPITEQFPDT